MTNQHRNCKPLKIYLQLLYFVYNHIIHDIAALYTSLWYRRKHRCDLHVVKNNEGRKIQISI